MRINVTDKTERVELGNIIELRGNFTEVQHEEELSYQCDMYRTTDKTKTFEELHKKHVSDEAQKQLDATDKYVAKCYDLGLVFAEEYPELHEKRKGWRQDVRDGR